MVHVTFLKRLKGAVFANTMRTIFSAVNLSRSAFLKYECKKITNRSCHCSVCLAPSNKMNLKNIAA